MDALKIVRVRKALGLKREMVGIRFMPYKKEYDLSDATEKRHVALCEVVSDASRGIHGKTRSGMLSCKAAGYIIGLEEAPSNIRSGLEDYRNEKYASYSVSHQVSNSKDYIDHSIYGVEAFPVNHDVNGADIIIFITTAKNVMRIMQGYARYYGVAGNLLTMGVHGICSGLISRSFVNNDINISLLSPDSRDKGGFDAREMGVSVPVNMLETVLDGILETVNLTENNAPKREILARLEYPEELGFPIRMNYDYAIQAAEYSRYCEECMQYDSENG